MAFNWFHQSEGVMPLAKMKVAIVGLGGIGTNAAHLMDEAGIRHLILIDDDTIELDNLQRQTLYDETDLGEHKVIATAKKIGTGTIGHRVRLTKDNVRILKSDLVLDACDNLETRFLINSYCIEKGIPYVYCTVAGDHGFVKFINQRNGCLQCFYKKSGGETSQNVGILNTAVQMAAAIQAHLALLYLTGKTPPDDLISFDVWHEGITRIRVQKDPHCIICGTK
jgi:molybdopterin-synthase adenylyltransferase